MEKNEEEKLMSGYFPSNVDDGVDLIFARAKLVNIVVSTILIVPVLLVMHWNSCNCSMCHRSK